MLGIAQGDSGSLGVVEEAEPLHPRAPGLDTLPAVQANISSPKQQLPSRQSVFLHTHTHTNTAGPSVQDRTQKLESPVS